MQTEKVLKPYFSFIFLWITFVYIFKISSAILKSASKSAFLKPKNIFD